MSIEAMVWVLRNSEAKLGPRLVLISLADHAHADGTEAYPCVDTIASHTRLSRRSVQAALRTLEADGEIVRDGVGRKGQVCWRLTMGGADSAPRADNDPEGRSSRPGGGADSAPNPSIEPSKNRPASAHAREASQKLPDDFPDGLVPHAREVFRILRSVAQAYNAKEVTPKAVGHAMLSARGRRYIEEAHKMAAWCEGSNRPVKDVVARYQRWLGNADQHAGIEPLNGLRAVPNSASSTTSDYEAMRISMEAKARKVREKDAQAQGMTLEEYDAMLDAPPPENPIRLRDVAGDV